MERIERAERNPGRHRSTGDAVEHPNGHESPGAVRRLADRDLLTTPVLTIEHKDATPDERMVRVMDLDHLADAGRMNGTL